MTATFASQSYNNVRVELKFSLGAERPIEVWTIYPSGEKSCISMDAHTARGFVADIQKLVDFCAP